MRLFPAVSPILVWLQLFVLLCAATAGSVKAATLLVTTTADNGVGSLRDTIAAASDGDTIQFDPALSGQTIGLTGGQLVINKNITISGPGPNLLAVSRASASRFRIFYIMSGHTITIEGLTISGGYGDASNGGGIFNDQATLTINNCIVSGWPDPKSWTG